MAAKKKSKGILSQLSFNFNKFKLDARVPKLLGLLFLLFAFYLFIAFSSYLFTWEADQDQVLQFSWGLLLQSDSKFFLSLGRCFWRRCQQLADFLYRDDWNDYAALIFYPN